MADLIAMAIADRAADRVFAFPGGGSNLEVIDALERFGVRVVLARSEGGAALMAATYADLIGRPAVVLVGLGPGVANVVNGLAHAMLDQSSVILISDRFTDAERQTTGHQVLDHLALLAPVVKWQAVLAADDAGASLDRAATIASEPPCGPVHLELPRDVATAPTSRRGTAPSQHRLGSASGPDPGAVSLAASIVAAARRPVMLVGDEALQLPQTDLVGLAERLTAPVLNTYKAKGAFPEDHRLWCGLLTNGALEAPVLREADGILAVGLDPVELLPAPWPATAPVVALRQHTERVRGYTPHQVVIGQLPLLVEALSEDLGSSQATWSDAEVAQRRSRLLSGVRVRSSASLTALEVVEAVQAAAPAETTVAVDAGAHMFAATWGWRATRPRRFLMSNGHATMGYAVPAAIAAALARPGEPVVAFTGDGGFLLHGTELETATRVGAKILVVVLNDSSLSLIRIKQHERRYRRAAVDFGPVDCASFARSLGATATTVSTAEELRAAVVTGLGESFPTVVEVQVSGSEYGALQRVLRVTGAPSEQIEEPVWTA